MFDNSKKIELLMPAGNIDCLRAAVTNGADAVYLGLKRFNARAGAGNFMPEELNSIVRFCHEKDVKVYIALNTIVKNYELEDYLEQVNIAVHAKADAIIIQDSCLVKVIKKNFPEISIHISTQATTTNSYSIPKGVDRIVLPRELDLDEIKTFSINHETEAFVHGALCVCYSGQCLFSSLVGRRSGNRGLCAQPCRKIYNNKYALSTKDLCLVDRLDELKSAGVKSLKVEGRMRSPLYVGIVARIYRKKLDGHELDEEDYNNLKIAFNREFTEGFGFVNSILDTKQPMNRGLYLGFVKEGKIHLKADIEKGDGISIWKKDEVIGKKINFNAEKDKIINAPSESGDGDKIFKTFSVSLKVDLGEDIPIKNEEIKKIKIKLPEIKKSFPDEKMIIATKAYSKKHALELDKAKADIIYYDVLADDIIDVKNQLQNSRLFLFTPKIANDNDIRNISKKIMSLKPEGVLIQNRGFFSFFKDMEIHSDIGAFNDIDINCYEAQSILSRELSFEDIKELESKNVIIQIHGDIVLMVLKQKIKAPELIDEEGRHFKIRESHFYSEVLNCNQLGLFNRATKLIDLGIRKFFIDCKDSAKYVKIYRKILSGEKFEDKKIKKGFTTGHFLRGI